METIDLTGMHESCTTGLGVFKYAGRNFPFMSVAYDTEEKSRLLGEMFVLNLRMRPERLVLEMDDRGMYHLRWPNESVSLIEFPKIPADEIDHWRLAVKQAEGLCVILFGVLDETYSIGMRVIISVLMHMGSGRPVQARSHSGNGYSRAGGRS